MRYSIIVVSSVLAVTIVLSLAANQDVDKNPRKLGRCTTSESCSNSSIKCVDGFCTICTNDPRTCMRNYEDCKALRCRRDQACYISEKYDRGEETVTSRLVCSQTLPCRPWSCPRKKCVNVARGEQPPYNQCRPSSEADQCPHKHCKDNNCAIRAYWSLGYAYKNAVCLGEGSCANCKSNEYCEITGKDDDDAEDGVKYTGQCVPLPSNGQKK